MHHSARAELIHWPVADVGDCNLTLQWLHNERDSVSNHRGLHRLLTCWFTRRSQKTSKLPVTGLCVGNSPGTGKFPAQRASNAKNVAIWWRHHETQTRSGYLEHFLWNGRRHSRYFLNTNMAAPPHHRNESLQELNCLANLVRIIVNKSIISSSSIQDRQLNVWIPQIRNKGKRSYRKWE